MQKAYLIPFIKNAFLKRQFKPLNDSKIVTHELPEFFSFVLMKLFPKQSDRWVFMVDRWHDQWVRRKLQKWDFDILIAYENASLESLKKAKTLSKITILDLAHVHHSLTARTFYEFASYRKAFSSPALFDQICRLKDEQNKYVDYFLVLSELAKRTLVDAGFDSNSIFKVNLGFDPKNFRLKQFSTKTHFTILFVGTISRKKGVHLLLQAFRELNLPGTTLVLVGSPGDGKDLLEGLPQNIVHKPFVNHEQLALIYQQADIFVFPSFLDSWGMVVIEAMACGTPVIVSENTGAREVVEKGAGFVIPVGDVEEIKKKIILLYKDRSTVEKLGRQAHELAQQYTWENYYLNVQSAIDEIVRRTITR